MQKRSFGKTKDGKEVFDYGQWMKDIGTQVWKFPASITEKITSKLGKS